MFVFYYGGGGARGAIFSLGLSLGLCVINFVPFSLLASFAVLALSVGGFLYRDQVRQAYRESMFTQRSWWRPQPSHFDEVLGRLRTMHTENWRPAKDLTISELRSRVRSKASFVERSELEKAYREAIDDLCPICAEGWDLGDVYRRLERCGHCFHVECIDKWAITSADKGRTPLCPLCKASF